MSSIILLLILGHFFAALFVYLNHRFVFHGKLGNLPLLKKFTTYHTLHHAHPIGKKCRQHIFVPLWAKILFILMYSLVGYVFSGWFALGMVSFSGYYSINHLKIHEKLLKTHSYYHHIDHHGRPDNNFSGMYPFIDQIFGSYIESRPIEK